MEPDTRYVYRIKARNTAGLSARSGWFDADTPSAPAAEEQQVEPQPPAASTNLFTAATHDQVLLNWTEPYDDNITGYRILRRPDADSLTTLKECQF